MSFHNAGLGAAPRAQLDATATPQQLRDALATQPERALEVAVHPGADEALRQWLWQSGDDELRLGMYQHYLHQREQLLAAWQPLPPRAIQFDAAVAQAQQLLEAGRMPVAADPSLTRTAAASAAEISHAGEMSPVGEGFTGEGSTGAPAIRTFLRLSDGRSLELLADRALLGRHPQHGAYAGAQLVEIPDPSRQLSSTHALLERHGGQWHLTDLHSTNGTVLGVDRHAPLAAPGIAYIAPSRFVIGRQLIELVVE